MLDEQRPRHLPAAREFLRKRRPFLDPRATAVATVDGEVESLTGPVTLTQISTISAATTSSSSRVSTTVKSSTPSTIASASVSSASTMRSSSSTLSSTISSFSQFTSVSAISVSPSASAVASSSATSTGSTENVIGAESNGSTSELSGGAVAAIAIGVLVLVTAAAVLIGRRCMVMRRQRKRTTARWLNGFSAPNPEAFIVPDRASAQPTMSMVNPSYGDGYAYTPTLNGAGNGTRGAVAGFAAPATPAASYNNAPTTPGLSPRTAISNVVNRATVQCTFVPNLPDELTVLNGEVLNVLQEYDDGWVFCSNSKGETGMVPLECLAYETGSEFWGERLMAGSRRVSSISGRV
ncbi:hypothetical protein F5879DRAFT_875726 [Lentinula edodes]|nr:hypothetical protein F5879DRAFT_875726 [Lentinula edodes]